MKYCLVSLMLFVNVISSFSQDIGYYFTIHGQEVDHYITPLNAGYSSVNLKLSKARYSPCIIHFNNGNTENDMLSMSGKIKNEDGEVYNLEDIESIICAKDSFVVINTKNWNASKPEMAYFPYIDETSVYELFGDISSKTYYLYNKITGQWKALKYGQGMAKGSARGGMNTTAVQKNSSKEITLLFSNFPFIHDGSFAYSTSEMPRLVKEARYYEYFQKGKPILFDAFWEETDSVDYMNYALIENYEDGEWQISFHNKPGNKIMSGTFNNITPLTPDGVLNTYYSNGDIRSRNIYENGWLDEITKYYTGNSVQSVIKKKTGNDKIRNLFAENGSGIPFKNITVEQIIKDEVSGQKFKSIHKDGTLMDICSVDDKNGKVCRYFKNMFYNTMFYRDFRYNNDELVKEVFWNQELSSVIVKIHVSPLGVITNHELLTETGNTAKKVINDYFEQLGQSPCFKIKPKYKNIERFECLMFFTFGLVSPAVDSPYFYDWNLHHQLHMRNTMPNITPPTMP